MKSNYMRKIISIILITFILMIKLTTIIQAATDILSADIKYVKDCGNHLQAKDKNGWYTIVASYVEYEAPNGKKYPAYCLDNTKPGVGNSSIGDLPEGYTVNVTKLLEDSKVYTAAINGYPYKTPEELGLENKYDAFIATKQAIYSVLYGYNVDEHYRGVDERGNAIKKAINKIVTIARTKPQSQKTALIKFNKIGGLIEDEINSKYYSQTYSVSSDVNIKDYTISEIKNFTKNTIITDVNNNKKNTFMGNEKFKILIPKNELENEKDINGNIIATMKCKNYPIFYAKKSSQLQPYALTYDSYGENPASTNLLVKMNTGRIQVVKVDNESRKPIQGVKFELSKPDGNLVETKITDKNGIAIFENLYEGKYILKEIDTKEEYNINNETFNIDVVYNKTTEINIENELKKGQIKIIKLDKDNNEVKLENVEFEVIEQNGNILEKIKTDKNGEALTQKYPVNQFETLKIKEVKTNKGYILSKEIYTIKLKANEVTELIIYNEKVPEVPKIQEKPKLPRTGF